MWLTSCFFKIQSVVKLLFLAGSYVTNTKAENERIAKYKQMKKFSLLNFSQVSEEEDDVLATIPFPNVVYADRTYEFSIVDSVFLTDDDTNAKNIRNGAACYSWFMYIHSQQLEMVIKLVCFF